MGTNAMHVRNGFRVMRLRWHFFNKSQGVDKGGVCAGARVCESPCICYILSTKILILLARGRSFLPNGEILTGPHSFKLLKVEVRTGFR